MNLTLSDIRAARERIKDSIYHTPCPYSLLLSRLCGCEIYSKLDHLQVTGSFKERGARNKLLTLSSEERQRGVVCASAGNHALGVAHHGQLLGIPVRVYMPKWAPMVKVSNCRSFGAEVLQQGETFEEAYSLAQAAASEQHLTFIPGFDDPYIIAGQGTAGLEILEDVPDVEAIVIPVGGGGLLAGVGLAVKALKPSVKIIAVESDHAPTLAASMQAKCPTRVQTQPTLADGLAVSRIGAACFDIIPSVMDELIIVDEATIAKAILRLLELDKMVIEGAGAVPLAAMMRKPHGLEGKKVVLLLSGGNIDVTMISRVIERGLAADGRLVKLNLSISDRPGSLARLLTTLASTDASINQVHHDRSFGPADVARVGVEITLETRDFAHIESIRHTLKEAGFVVV